MKVGRAISWSVFGQILSFAMSFGSSILVARLLSPLDLGVFAIAMAIIAVLNILSAFGVGTYVVRATTLHPSTLNSAFTLNAILAVGMAAIIFTASAVERYQFDNLPVARVLAPLAFGPLIGIFEFRPAIMLQREMNFRLLSLINVLKSLVAMVAVISLAMNGFVYMSLAYSSLIATVFGTVGVNLVAGKHAGFRLSLSEGRAMAAFGINMMAISGVNSMAARLSEIVLGNMLGLAALGLYSRATNVSGQIFDNIYGGITRVLFVQLSTDFRERGVLREAFLRGFEMIMALIWPLLIGLAILSRPLIYILYGERWLDAAKPLSLLLAAQFVVIFYGMNWELFVLRNQTAKQARYEAIRAVAGVAVFSIGCFFSISAAAVGRIAEALLGLALYQPHMAQMAGTLPGELKRAYLTGAALTLAAVLPSFGLMVAEDWSHLTPPALIAGAVLLGAIMWLMLLIHLKHPLATELHAVGRRQLGGRP